MRRCVRRRRCRSDAIGDGPRIETTVVAPVPWARNTSEVLQYICRLLEKGHWDVLEGASSNGCPRVTELITLAALRKERRYTRDPVKETGT